MKIKPATLCVLVVMLGFVYPSVAVGQKPAEASDPPISNPAYKTNAGPLVAIDEGHHNYNTIGGRFAPFANLLRKDGYRVAGLNSKLSAEALREVNTLVIVNALVGEWESSKSLPTASAFEISEIDAVVGWVNGGGSLLLIAGHMPWPGAAEMLAERFDVLFQNGFAFPQDPTSGEVTTSSEEDTRKLARWTLKKHPIFMGRSSMEVVPSIRAGAGQGFRVRPGGMARGLAAYEGHWMQFFPTVAWQFSEQTPKIRADGLLVAAVATPGKGRAVFFGGAASVLTGDFVGPLRASDPDAKRNSQFVLNVMHWLSGLLPAE